MPQTPADLNVPQLIDRALALATQNRHHAPPNPAIGCVLARADGLVIGEGFTQKTGGPHAEIMAIRDAEARGHLTTGATAFVTLEPCSHHGRTGPCCDALVAAGIRRVVASMEDPNPLVCGQGFARLRAAGVEVQIGEGAQRARELNIGFFSRMIRKTPWVRLKVAASLDGKTALENGASQWITSEPARVDGHAWRARSCAVLTGIGTVLEDNPSLDVRLVETQRQPHLVVVDSRLETPIDAKLLGPKRKVFIYCAQADPEKKSALEARGTTVVVMPQAASASGADGGKVDLRAMLADLAVREVNEVHVEAGHKLNGSMVREGLVDEFLVYLAPKLLGQGRGMANFGPLTELGQALQLEFKSTAMIGLDLRLLAGVAGRDQF